MGLLCKVSFLTLDLIAGLLLLLESAGLGGCADAETFGRPWVGMSRSFFSFSEINEAKFLESKSESPPERC